MAATATPTMTPKQQEVYDLMQQDVPAPQIAERLGISKSAVYGHIRDMKERGALPDDSTRTTRSRKSNGGGPRRSRTSEPITQEAIYGDIAKSVAAQQERIDARREAITAERVSLNKQLDELAAEESGLDRLKAQLAGIEGTMLGEAAGTSANGTEARAA